ncbi:MAG: type II asparaginase [Bacteroidales bacterium]|nr:type II asparaginase [Bacteroidales bacterium]
MIHFFSRSFLFSAVALLLSTSLITAQTQKPVVYILATGGTIAGTGSSSTAAQYRPGNLGVDQLLAAVPELSDIAEVKGEQVVNISSQDMTTQIWLRLANRINEILLQENVAGVVITHGTDTQEETAYFLNLTVKSHKPVVLTGSMRPSTALSADGPRNLYNAVACAVSPESKGQGVMLLMDDRILSADDLTKTHTLNVSTFQSPNYGPIGYMYDGKPIFVRNSHKRHTIQSEFDIATFVDLPRVEIIMGYAGANELFIRAAIQAGVKGIVYAGVGNGNPPTLAREALTQASREGIAVVRATRVPTGPSTQGNEVDDDQWGFVASWMLNPQKSRVLLMLALTKTTDFREIQRMFLEY